MFSSIALAHVLKTFLHNFVKKKKKKYEHVCSIQEKTVERAKRISFKSNTNEKRVLYKFEWNWVDVN